MLGARSHPIEDRVLSRRYAKATGACYLKYPLCTRNVTRPSSKGLYFRSDMAEASRAVADGHSARPKEASRSRIQEAAGQGLQI